VEVPSPRSQDGDPKLIVYTEDFEVTVVFASFHNHFDWPVDDVDLWTNALSFVGAILNEDVAAASGWNEDKWAGSWLVNRGEPISPPTNLSPMKTIRVRSWNGTLNQDLTVS
jgi:hypothetical protein